MRGEAEVGLSVVEAVVVDVVDLDFAVGVHYGAMHGLAGGTRLCCRGPSHCIERSSTFGGIPFVGGEGPVVGWVYYCEFAAG